MTVDDLPVSSQTQRQDGGGRSGRLREKRGVMGKMRTGLWLLLPVAITGCSVLGGGAVKKDTFELRVPAIAQSSPVRRGVQVLVAEPTALKALDSQNVVVQTSPYAIRYLDESQWSDRLPKIVQARFAQALEDTGRFKGVGLPGQGLAIDYQIVSNIREFGIDAGSNTAVVSVAVKILNDRNGVVASDQLFEARVQAAGTSNDAYVGALDAAFGAVTRDAVAWITGRI